MKLQALKKKVMKNKNSFHTQTIIPASLLLLSLVFVFTTKKSYSMENSDYSLELENGASVESVKTPIAPLDITAKEIKGPGYKAILSYDTELKPSLFSMSNSTNILNFGEIKPGEPLLRSNTLTIIPGSAPGFQVSAYVDHQLRSSIKSEIPHTSCDNGNCTDVLPDTWALPLTYGFGFRCDNLQGKSCDMNIKETYKRFAGLDAKESPTTILHSNDSITSIVEFSHKINIPGNQTLTGYKSNLFLISSPIL